MEIETVEYIVFFTIIIIPVIISFFYKHPQNQNIYINEVNKLESPIERRLYFGLINNGIQPISQYRVGRYRLDLAIPSKMIAIEADGKAYHSTPNQKEHDRKRDQYLRSKGWTVMRFSGSRIHRDLGGCVYKIKNEIYSRSQ